MLGAPMRWSVKAMCGGVMRPTSPVRGRSAKPAWLEGLLIGRFGRNFILQRDPHVTDK